VGLNCCVKNKGFSLLELIISVAVLAIGITAVLQAFSFSAMVSGLSGDFINAAFLAQDKIQELEFKEKQNLLNKEPAEIKEGAGKFAVAYALDLDADLKLYTFTLDITWLRAKKERMLHLRTFLR
jgi:prepilin-type N-terminal cleavage/methylation domain-containing protein